MDLHVPRALGGTRYLRSVTVGRDPEAATVRDCPACGGRTFDDDWHVVARVVDVADGSTVRIHCCSPGCLDGWLT